MIDLPCPVVDCDIHNTIPSLKTLYPYLPDFWCDYLEESAFVGPDSHDYPAGSPFTALPGSEPESGPPGSDLDRLREQTVEAWQSDFGILTCNYWTSRVHHEDLALALSSAINDWQMDTFLNLGSGRRWSYPGRILNWLPGKSTGLVPIRGSCR